ncbi:uncharacterized protein J3R85_015676 [Psidium guajava]|nr:uncharacterized protein J3R85_015676 [Psidium guajava]
MEAMLSPSQNCGPTPPLPCFLPHYLIDTMTNIFWTKTGLRQDANIPTEALAVSTEKGKMVMKSLQICDIADNSNLDQFEAIQGQF